MRRRHDDDDDDALRDGEFVRTPMWLMDGGQRAIAGVDLSDHQPGYRTGERYRRAYADYCPHGAKNTGAVLNTLQKMAARKRAEARLAQRVPYDLAKQEKRQEPQAGN